MIDDFQEGDEITVYVDPDDHGESVLIQGLELKSLSFPLSLIHISEPTRLLSIGDSRVSV